MWALYDLSQHVHFSDWLRMYLLRISRLKKSRSFNKKCKNCVDLLFFILWCRQENDSDIDRQNRMKSRFSKFKVLLLEFMLVLVLKYDFKLTSFNISYRCKSQVCAEELDGRISHKESREEWLFSGEKSCFKKKKFQDVFLQKQTQFLFHPLTCFNTCLPLGGNAAPHLGFPLCYTNDSRGCRLRIKTPTVVTEVKG